MRITRRNLFQLGALGTMGMMTNGLQAGGAAGEVPVNEEQTPHDWLRKRQRIYWYDQYALNEQETAFANYDPDRIAAELKTVGADIVAVYAANQFSVAYYPSKVWPMHPNLKGRDYFGEVSSRLKAQGQKVIGYINWLESRHPEWYVAPLGGEKQQEFPLASWAQPDNPDWRVQKVPGGKWRFACINSPRREQVLAVAREIIEGYHPDGFHLDMCFNDCVCVCDYCRPALERICGTSDITLDVVNAHWREFVDWRNECSASLVGEVSAMLREHGVFAAHNGQNPLWLSPIYGFDRNLLPHLDPYVSEIFYDLHTADLTMRWHQAIGKPSCMLVTGTSPSHAHLSIPLQAWQVSAACAKANGCSILGPCGVGAYPDTTSSKRLLDTVRQGLDFFMEDADLHDGARPAAKVALVFSWATRNYFREGRLDWSQELDGWSRVLIEEHIPFEIVVAEDIQSAEGLQPYRLVILPNTAFLSDACCTALTAYVHEGGRVLATGETSLGDERGFDRDDFALGTLFGITRKGVTEGTFAMDGPLEPEPAAGVFQQVAASAEVLSLRLATDPAGPVAGGPDPFPMAPTEWPVAVVQKTGQGQALYVAFGLGRYYVLQSLTHARDRMVRYLDLLLPERQLKVQAPRHLEVNVWHQETPERFILHLANRTPLAHDMPKIHEIAPVCDVRLEMVNPYPAARVTFRGAEGTAAMVGNKIAITIPRMEVYAAVLIEAKDKA
ncbi:MAG TPA: beta-galactosidase trimerization domain-containing protein [Candidatus Hydrogenedentes bacterium]|nr:beta-galactosidase trimerization domain-containing protein [Candidatus Hydrogenedentota bacterium]